MARRQTSADRSPPSARLVAAVARRRRLLQPHTSGNDRLTVGTWRAPLQVDRFLPCPCSLLAPMESQESVQRACRIQK